MGGSGVSNIVVGYDLVAASVIGSSDTPVYGAPVNALNWDLWDIVRYSGAGSDQVILRYDGRSASTSETWNFFAMLVRGTFAAGWDVAFQVGDDSTFATTNHSSGFFEAVPATLPNPLSWQSAQGQIVTYFPGSTWTGRYMRAIWASAGTSGDKDLALLFGGLAWQPSTGYTSVRTEDDQQSNGVTVRRVILEFPYLSAADLARIRSIQRSTAGRGRLIVVPQEDGTSEGRSLASQFEAFVGVLEPHSSHQTDLSFKHRRTTLVFREVLR